MFPLHYVYLWLDVKGQLRTQVVVQVRSLGWRIATKPNNKNITFEVCLFWFMAYSTRNITFGAHFLWFMAYKTKNLWPVSIKRTNCTDNINRNTLCPDVIMRCTLCMCASNVDGLYGAYNIIICQLLLVRNSAAVLNMTGANYKSQAELVQLCSVGAVLKILTLKK